MNRYPDTSRFDEYEENKDGTGFIIEEGGRQIEFFYDPLRGWFDEEGNYFNKDGKPSKPSKESLTFWQSIQHKYKGKYQRYDDYDDDDLLKEYERGNADDDQDDEDDDLMRQAEIEQDIAKLRTTIQTYADGQDVKVYFEGMRWSINEQDIQSLFGKVKDVVFNRKGKYPVGSGHVVLPKANALKIADLHRSEYKGEQIFLSVEALDVNLVDDPDHDDIPVPNPTTATTGKTVQLQRNQNMMSQNSTQQTIPTHQTSKQTPHTEVKKNQQEEQKQTIQAKPQQSVPAQVSEQSNAGKSHIEAKPQTQSQTPKPTGFDIMVSGLKIEVSQQEFEEWLKSKTQDNVQWLNVREKRDEKAVFFKLNFSTIEMGKKIFEIEAFKNPSKVMYKGKYSIQFKQMWS